MNRKNATQHNKGYILQIYVQHYTKWSTTETIPTKVREKIGKLAFPTPINYSFGIPGQSSNKREKKSKRIQLGKEEVKVSLFADDMILYLEHPINYQESVKNLNSFSKEARYKINIQKSVAFLYTNNEKTDKSGKQSHL
jgi:hypothetical protein